MRQSLGRLLALLLPLLAPEPSSAPTGRRHLQQQCEVGVAEADVNRDGTVSVADILLALGAFGRQGVGLPADVNGSGLVDVSDLLLVLGAFGRSCGGGTASAAGQAGATSGGGAGVAPHLVFVLVDDLGFADIFDGSADIQTPHWTALAANGVRMSRYYVQPLCSPARGTLMAGRYPVRLGSHLQHFSVQCPFGFLGF